MKYKSLGILGSTGSIGVQTLSLIKKEKSQIRLSLYHVIKILPC